MTLKWPVQNFMQISSKLKRNQRKSCATDLPNICVLDYKDTLNNNQKNKNNLYFQFWL